MVYYKYIYIYVILVSAESLFILKFILCFFVLAAHNISVILVASDNVSGNTCGV